MAQKITFEADKDYTLEFSRDTAKQLYSAGWHPGLFTTNPIEATEMLVFFAFRKHHPSMKRSKAVELVGELTATADGSEDTLAGALIEMVTEALEETVIKKTGNVSWQVLK